MSALLTMTTHKLFREHHDHDDDLRPSTVAPGKTTATSRLSGSPRIIFRVESAEAAAVFAEAFGPRDRDGVAAGADVAVDRAASSSGQALPEDLRGRFESSLGADLSGVRVHTGSESAEASGAVGAKAYTTGQDIHFGAGQYDPSSAFGVHLIAHEVAHTVQQQGSAPTRQNKLEVSAPQDSAEVEADRAADAMVRGATTRVSSLGSDLGRQVLFRAEGEGGGSSEADGAQGRDGGTNPIYVPPDAEPTPDLDPGGANIPPPAPLDWSAVAATPATPAGPWNTAPQFEPEWSAPGNLATYRAAFSAAWSQAQGSYNNLVSMNQTIKAGEKELPPALFKASKNANLGMQQSQVNASDAFEGNKLKSSVSAIDPSKVPEATRKEILLIREVKLPAAEAAVLDRISDVRNAKDESMNQEGVLDTAHKALAINDIEKEAQGIALDKEQIKRELDDFKVKVKATVDSVKAVTSIAGIFVEADPAKAVGNALKAVDATAQAAGSGNEANAVIGANKLLKAMDDKLGALSTRSAGLKHTNAETIIENAVRTVRIGKRKIDTAFRGYETAINARDQLYREMATNMKAAGASANMSEKDQQLLAGAVEAIPMIRRVLKFVEGLDGNLPTPAYSAAAGIGAAMASNTCEFSTNLGLVKGGKEFVAEQKTLWEGRLAAVEAVMAQATAKPSDF